MTRPGPKRAFGQVLRSLREERRLSMSAVARAIRVSVVYYRDVERGTRRPFSSIKIDFAALATTLGANADELQRAAAEARGQLELDLRAPVEHIHQDSFVTDALGATSSGAASSTRMHLLRRRRPLTGSDSDGNKL